jgi:myo-inositol-1(or 4)-monophosphatase
VSEIHDLLHIAKAAAQRAAAHIRTIERPPPASWQMKGKSDFVTRVDLETEQLVTDMLTRATPGATVLGEELSPRARSADLLWVVDPLDGTTNFLHGYPAYAVSIAAVTAGEPAVAVVVDIVHDLTYHATRGGGAWCGNERLQVSQITAPASALIGTGFPFKVPDLLPDYLRQFATILVETSGIRRAGAASLDFADLARGRFDGFWELHLAPWDVAAGALLVREAGGCVTDPGGHPDLLRHGAFVAGNPKVHAWLLEVLRR